MLFRTNGKHRRALSFDQELSCLKSPPSCHPDFQKSQEGFQMIVTVLELIIDKSPQMVSELLVVKEALTKWYDHIQNEHLSQTTEMFNLREKIEVSIRKEVGLTLEEIAYYLRSVLQEYQDQHLETYYVKYLYALKKLDWGRDYSPKKGNRYNNAQTQTLIQDGHLQMCSSPHLRVNTSLSTIQTPLKTFKDIDIHKYLQTKEENLFLQREIDQLKSIIGKLESENAKLKQQLAMILNENSHLKESQSKLIEEIGKLTDLLGQHKQSEALKEERQREAEKSWQMTTSKYPKRSLKHAVSLQLDFAEEQIRRKEQQSIQKKAEEYLNNNYDVRGDSCLQSERTSRKGHNGFQEDSLHRMLIVQALAIEDLMQGNAEKD